MVGFKAPPELSFHLPGGICSFEEPLANSGNGASSEGPWSIWDPNSSFSSRQSSAAGVHTRGAGPPAVVPVILGQPVGNKDVSPGNQREQGAVGTCFKAGPALGALWTCFAQWISSMDSGGHCAWPL